MEQPKWGEKIINEKKKDALKARSTANEEDRLPKRVIQNFSLNKSEAKQEIKYLQSKLSKDDAIGYVYTNNNSILEDHFEVVIITNNRIIKPVVWDNVSDGIISDWGWHTSKISDHFILETTERRNKVLPQAGKFECATLGLLYLKTLLKDNAYQLNELTLSIPYFEKTGKFEYFFIPSPQCLYYSQSGFFNKVIKEMLLNENNGVVDWQRSTETAISIKVKTIEDLLNETISKTRDIKLINNCESIMQNLPFFRNKWIEQFEKINKKRDEMYSNGLNKALIYHTQRYRNICEDISTRSLDYISKDIQRLENGRMIDLHFHATE